MLQFVHDYRLPAEAMEHLFTARRLLAVDCVDGALDHIDEARCSLDKYLALDNVLPDDDCENGWVKMDDALQLTFSREQLDCIRWYIGKRLKEYPNNQPALVQLGIINRCQELLGYPCFDNVQEFLDNYLGNWSKTKSP